MIYPGSLNPLLNTKSGVWLSGGIVREYSEGGKRYREHFVTSSMDLDIISGGEIEEEIVGAGAGGASNVGGAGGPGEVKRRTRNVIAGNKISVIIGKGSLGNNTSTGTTANGGDSSVDGFVAIGGKGGTSGAGNGGDSGNGFLGSPGGGPPYYGGSSAGATSNASPGSSGVPGVPGTGILSLHGDRICGGSSGSGVGGARSGVDGGAAGQSASAQPGITPDPNNGCGGGATFSPGYFAGNGSDGRYTVRYEI